MSEELTQISYPVYQLGTREQAARLSTSPQTSRQSS
jgi:hypothetical protein